jgi:non-specific protein-tyrosine kinase
MVIARRRWWVIALTTIAAVGLAFAGLLYVKPSYTATATLQSPIVTGVQTPTDLTYLDRLMNTYTQLAQQSGFRAAVAQDLRRRTAPSLSLTVEPNTELLMLSASDASAAAAQQAANTAASILVQRATALARSTSAAGEQALTGQLDALSQQITVERRELASLRPGAASTDKRVSLEQTISNDNANYQALVSQRAQLQLADAVRNQPLSIVQPASLPTSPSSPRWPPVLALALALGLLGGFAVAFLLERLVPRLYTVEAIESAADRDVLAAIPEVPRKQAELAPYNGGSPAQEAFGVLAVHVLAYAQERGVRTVLVTSRNKGDGKSTVALNLGAELARSGHRVLLVDADLRDPSLHRKFGFDNGVGLGNLLQSAAMPWTLDEFIVQPDKVSNLSVLPAGSPSAGPAPLLASQGLEQLVAELRRRYDFIVFDAPPLVVSDPLSLAMVADLVLLVVEGSGAPDQEVQLAVRRLSSIGADHVSVVVNRWRGRRGAYDYTYGTAQG